MSSDSRAQQFQGERERRSQRLFPLNHLSGGPTSPLPPSHEGDGTHEPTFPEGSARPQAGGQTVHTVPHCEGLGGVVSGGWGTILRGHCHPLKQLLNHRPRDGGKATRGFCWSPHTEPDNALSPDLALFQNHPFDLPPKLAWWFLTQTLTMKTLAPTSPTWEVASSVARDRAKRRLQHADVGSCLVQMKLSEPSKDHTGNGSISFT